MLLLADKASVPVCVHLDHGTDLDYVKKGLDLGFTPVMYDGSTLDQKLNFANTSIAHGLFTSVGRADRISDCEDLNKKMSEGHTTDFELKVWVRVCVRIAENSIITRKLWRSPTTSIFNCVLKDYSSQKCWIYKEFCGIVGGKTTKGENYGNKKATYQRKRL